MKKHVNKKGLLLAGAILRDGRSSVACMVRTLKK